MVLYEGRQSCRNLGMLAAVGLGLKPFCRCLFSTPTKCEPDSAAAHANMPDLLTKTIAVCRNAAVSLRGSLLTSTWTCKS